MERYSLENRWEIIKNIFSKSHLLKLIEIEKNGATNLQFLDQSVERVREPGLLVDKPTRVRSRTANSNESNAAILV